MTAAAVPSSAIPIAAARSDDILVLSPFGHEMGRWTRTTRQAAGRTLSVLPATGAR
jgi:hypothetical protein